MTGAQRGDHVDAEEGFDHRDPSLSAAEIREMSRRMRDGGCPVVHSDHHGGFYIINKYEDVRAVLADPDTFVSGQGVMIPQSDDAKIPALEHDAAEHEVWRTILEGPLNPRAVRGLEPAIRDVANGLIDQFASVGTADLFASFAEPMPAIVIGSMVGIDDPELALEGAALAVARSASKLTPQFAERAAEFEEFVERLLADRRERPRDDYLTQMASGTVAGVNLGSTEVAALMSALILGGHHSTGIGIAGLLRNVLGQADRGEYVRDRRAMSRVIEESLRLTSPFYFFARTAVRDAQIGDAKVSAGDRLLLNLEAANTDPQEFPDPDVFDPARRRTRQHVAFGAGLHLCQGQHLARAELRLALETLLHRLPDVHLTGPGEERGLHVGTLLNIASLPAAFTPR